MEVIGVCKLVLGDEDGCRRGNAVSVVTTIFVGLAWPVTAMVGIGVAVTLVVGDGAQALTNKKSIGRNKIITRSSFMDIFNHFASFNDIDILISYYRSSANFSIPQPFMRYGNVGRLNVKLLRPYRTLLVLNRPGPAGCSSK